MNNEDHNLWEVATTLFLEAREVKNYLQNKLKELGATGLISGSNAESKEKLLADIKKEEDKMITYGAVKQKIENKYFGK